MLDLDLGRLGLLLLLLGTSRVLDRVAPARPPQRDPSGFTRAAANERRLRPQTAYGTPARPAEPMETRY